MHMKHGGNGHVDIVAVEPGVTPGGSQTTHDT